MCSLSLLAKELHDAGAGRFGTQEEKFVDIFTGHSVEQMKAIAHAYDVQSGNSLERAVSSEFGGDAEKILQLLLLDPVDIYCRMLKKAMDGMGTNESAICRIIGGNEKETVQQITQRYQAKYNTSLVDYIASELSGDFKSAVVAYICTSDVSGGLEAINRLDPPPAMRPPPAPAEEETKTAPPAAVAAAAPAPVAESLYDEKGIPLKMTGWGTKEGHFFTNWKRRFFVLLSTTNTTTLGYYENELNGDGKDEKGMLNLRNYSVTVDGVLLHVKGALQDDKDLKINVENASDRDKWVQMLNTHIDYRKQRDEKQRAAQLKGM
jgi:hypothetical protein